MNVAVALLETASDVLALEVQECFVSLADLLLETELPSKAFRQVRDVGLEILLGELLVLFWLWKRAFWGDDEEPDRRQHR